MYHFAATGDFAWQDGDCLFEPLTPEDDAQAARWEKNRQKAFQGSPRHFLLTLLDSTSTDTGFTAYHVSTFSPSATAGKPRFLVKPTDFVSAGATPREYILDFDDYLEVIYTEERGSEKG